MWRSELEALRTGRVVAFCRLPGDILHLLVVSWPLLLDLGLGHEQLHSSPRAYVPWQTMVSEKTIFFLGNLSDGGLLMLELRDSKPQWPRVWDQADVFPETLLKRKLIVAAILHLHTAEPSFCSVTQHLLSLSINVLPQTSHFRAILLLQSGMTNLRVFQAALKTDCSYSVFVQFSLLRWQRVPSTPTICSVRMMVAITRRKNDINNKGVGLTDFHP